MSTNRIAIAGGFGSGKTTAAKYLRDEHSFEILGFATPLYELGEIHNRPFYFWSERVGAWATENLKPLGYDYDARERFRLAVLEVFEDTVRIAPKNRTLLQLIGTEVGRGFDPDLWIKLFALNVAKLGPDAKIVNDNLRFENEFEACRRMGFTVVYLDVPHELAAERYEAEYGTRPTPEQLAHKSESELEGIHRGCDYVLDNASPPAMLELSLSALATTGNPMDASRVL